VPTTTTFPVTGRPEPRGELAVPTTAVTRFKDRWSALGHALRTGTDEMLERNEGHPWKRGDLALSAMLNEVSHHGTQICMLRDLFSRR